MILFLNLLFCFNLSAKEIKKTPLDLSAADLETAHIFHTINQNLGKKTHDTIAFDKFKETQKSQVYKEFSPWFKRLFEISQIFSATELRKKCQEKTEATPLAEVTDKILKRFCYRNYLNMLAHEAVSNNKINNETKDVFVELVPILSSRDHQEIMAQFLNKIAHKSLIHAEYSKIITEQIIKNKVIPDQKLLKDINLNYELTQYIQQQGFNLPQTQKVFADELDELGRKITSSLGEPNLNEKIATFMKFYANNKQFLMSKQAKGRILFTGKELSTSGFFPEAQKILGFIAQDSDIEVAHEAIFVTLWSYIMQNDIAKAYDYADDNDLFDHYQKLSLKLKYWVAYTAELKKKTGQATKLYRELVELHPLSFYSMKAIKNITRLTEKETLPEAFENQTKQVQEVTLNDFSETAKFSLMRLKLWDQYNLKELREAEVEYLTGLTIESLKNEKSKLAESTLKESLFAFMAQMFAQNNNYILGFNLIQQALNDKKITPNIQILKSLFPILYMDEIKKFDRDIDPIILLSLIRQESGFNPKAKSQVGARGLMQLMPTTARMMNRKIKPIDLEKPETNLKLGIQYFKYLMKKYDGNLVFSLAAYNAGEHRVSRWQKDLFNKDEEMLQTIEKIPYQETRDYVKLIFRNMYFYKYLVSNKIDHGKLAKIYDIDLGFKH